MSSEKVTFSTHAQERIRKRRITFRRAREALEKGERVLLGSGATFVRYQGIGLILNKNMVVTVWKEGKHGGVA